MAEATNPMLSYYMMQDPLAAMKFQQQQALAQKMMEQGGEHSDPNQMIGNIVAPVSPIAEAAKAVQQLSGAYLQKKNMAKLAALMGGQPNVSQATNAAIGQGEGPATAQSVGQQLGTQMQKGNPLSGLPSVTGDPMKDWFLSQSNPELFKSLSARSLEEQKAQIALKNAGPMKAAEVAQTPQNFNGHIGFISPPGAGQPQGGTQPPMQAPSQSPPSSGLPPADANGLPLQNDNVKQLFGTALPSDNPNPQAPSSAPVDFNDPVAVKREEATAGKQGDALGDNLKTLNVMQANLPVVMQRFKQMSDAAKDASFGYGVDEEGTGPKQIFHNQFDPLLGRPEAKANSTLEQRSAQGILPELGPQLAQAGIRGNKFLETLASSASGLDLAASPEAKQNLIGGLKQQYIQNFKSTARQVRATGGQAPTEAEIDAMVAKTMQAPVAEAGATHKYIPGQGVMPLGGQ